MPVDIQDGLITSWNLEEDEMNHCEHDSHHEPVNFMEFLINSPQVHSCSCNFEFSIG